MVMVRHPAAAIMKPGPHLYDFECLLDLWGQVLRALRAQELDDHKHQHELKDVDLSVVCSRGVGFGSAAARLGVRRCGDHPHQITDN